VRAFGERFLEADGRLKRGELAELIFRDAHAREKLNRLLHPAMVERMREKIDALRRSGEAAVAVVEAANLVEMGGLELVDRVVMVTAPRGERLRRLMERDGLSRREAEQRLRLHEEMEIEETRADYLVDASGNEQDTRRSAGRLWRQLAQEARG
jgi:dephospho-CoA kinase